MAYIDVTDATFDQEVVQKSADVTVVIDLWAPWCGPCRTLGPIIEKVIDESKGTVILAKVNVDENPRISETFRVQSIPAVFAVRDRKIVDSFVGAIPEAQIRSWVGKLAPAKSKAEILIDHGIEYNDETSLRGALDLEPANARGVVALAELLVEKGEIDEALTLLAKVPETNETRRVAALARLSGEEPDGDDPTAELDELLTQVKIDEAAKQRFLDVLALMGEDPRVVVYRRKLAAQLF